MSAPGHPAIERLHLALADLERAAGERNLNVARYLLDTEVAEALVAIERAALVDAPTFATLLDAVALCRAVVGRTPR